MRNEKEILRKIHQLRFRKMKRFLSQKLSVVPPNCVHNLDQRPLRVCTLFREDLDPDTPYLVCDEKLDGGLLCRSCKHFNPAPKERLKDTFNRQMNDPQLLTQNYPDLAALLWVLDPQSPIPTSRLESVWFGAAEMYLRARAFWRSLWNR